MRSKIIFTFLVILCTSALKAQVLTETKVSLDYKDQSVQSVLRQLDRLEEVKLAYSPDILPDQTVSGDYENASLQKVLRDILGPQYSYKVRGSYVIIQKAPGEEAKKKVQFTGAITDAETGETIPGVTIYEVNKLDATISDESGHFDLTVSSKTDYVTFAISQEDYMDTLIMVKDVRELDQKITLIRRSKPKKDTTVTQRIGIETKKLVKFFTTFETRQNVRNVSLEEERLIQISFIPMIGTNGKLSGRVTNKVSLNVIAGYSRGVNGVELGGFYNIDRERMKGVQMAGFGNAVGGVTSGVQMAGFINTNKGYTSGFQAAGFGNLVADEVHGLQMGGFFNINTRKMDGAQLAGFVNINNRETSGFQAAGFTNITTETKAVQLAGFGNLATKESSGFQMAGFTNVSRDYKGSQMAGFMNVSGDMDGFQAAAFLNVSNNLKGVQLGVVNIADTVESGAMIGLVNIARNGKLEFGVEHNDFMDASLTFRSGTSSFYSILSGGMQLTDQKLWSYGIGFGSEFKVYKNVFSAIELSAHTLDDLEDQREEMNLLNRLGWNFGYRFGKHLSISGGPVLNLYISQMYNADTDAYGFDWGQSPFYEEIQGDTALSMWIGYAASIRF